MQHGWRRGALGLVCAGALWGAGCRGDLSDELRDLLGQGEGRGGSPGVSCGTGGQAGQPGSPDAGQPGSPDAGQPGSPDAGQPPTLALQTRADFNRDGYTDFVLDGRVLLGGPNGYAASWAIPAAPDGASGSIDFVAGDLNGDGFTDLIRLDVSVAQTPMGVWTATPIFGGASGFTAGSPNTEQPDLLSGSMYSYSPAGDVNGDGFADVVVKARSGAATFLGGPAGITLAGAPATATSQAFLAADGDLNGDGYSDAVSNANGESAIEQSFGSPMGFVRPATLVAAQPLIKTLVMLQANGDRFADVAFTTADGLQIFAGSPMGLSPVSILTIPGSVIAIGAADFNGDRHVDLIVANGSTLEVHTGAAGGVPSATGTALATPAQWKAAGFLGSFGDVNGDGYDDFTVGVMAADGSGYNPASAVLHLGGPTGLDPTGTAAM
jgi:FG-GAP-like repeat